MQSTDESTSWANRRKVAPKVRGQHQPIISHDLYDQVQEVRTRRAPKEPSGVGRRGGARRQRHAASIGGLLGSAITDLCLHPEWRQEVLDALDTNAEDAGRLKGERTAILRKMDRVKALLIDGDLTQQAYRVAKMRLDAELVRLAPPANRVNVERAAAMLGNLAVVWDQAQDGERKTLAAQMIDAVYCDPDHPDDVFIVLAAALHPLWEALPHCTTRVTDGGRTHNPWIHNPVLHH